MIDKALRLELETLVLMFLKSSNLIANYVPIFSEEGVRIQFRKK